jgi:PKD repeat protein
MKNLYKSILMCILVAASLFTPNAKAQSNYQGFEYSTTCLKVTLWAVDKRAFDSCAQSKFTVNGTYVTGPQASYTFPNAGTYTVCLKIYNSCKKWDTTICKSITVKSCDNPCNLTPAFTWKADCRKVKFVASGGISGATYYWTFGDGSTGSNADPSHTYVKDGTYKVCLIMAWKDPNTGQYCKKEVCKEVKVKCYEPCNIKGDFTFTSKGGLVKLPTQE